MARSNEYETARKLARAYLETLLTAEEKTLIHYAWFDLYFGPFPAGLWCEDPDYQWVGYEAACEQIEAILERLPGTLYVDTECDYVGEEEPEGYEDEETREWIEPEPYYTLEHADIKRAVLGKELAANL